MNAPESEKHANPITLLFTFIFGLPNPCYDKGAFEWLDGSDAFFKEPPGANPNGVRMNIRVKWHEGGIDNAFCWRARDRACRVDRCC